MTSHLMLGWFGPTPLLMMITTGGLKQWGFFQSKLSLSGNRPRMRSSPQWTTLMLWYSHYNLLGLLWWIRNDARCIRHEFIRFMTFYKRQFNIMTKIKVSSLKFTTGDPPLCRVPGAHGKAPKAHGKPFAVCRTRQSAHGNQGSAKPSFAVCYISGTRQRVCRVPLSTHDKIK